MVKDDGPRVGETLGGFLGERLLRQLISTLMLGGAILVAFGVVGAVIAVVSGDSKGDVGLLVVFAALGAIAVLVASLLMRRSRR